MQADQDPGLLADIEQFLATAEASILDARCQLPVASASKAYCTDLVRTLESCQQRYGLLTLHCNSTAATACITSLAEVQNGHCGTLWSTC